MGVPIPGEPGPAPSLVPDVPRQPTLPPPDHCLALPDLHLYNLVLKCTTSHHLPSTQVFKTGVDKTCLSLGDWKLGQGDTNSTLALPSTDFVTWSKLLNLSGLWFLNLQDRTDNN